MIPTQETLLERATHVPAPPVAVEAFWDGDTRGWFVILTLIYVEQSANGAQYREYDLAALRGAGGDLRLFNSEVPPWPEAIRAREVGEKLSTQFDIPFFFASPDYPEEACPRWWERARGYPCRQCGILLLQQERCPWRGVCLHCHLAAEREARLGGVDPT